MTNFKLSDERKKYYDEKYLKRYRQQKLDKNWSEYRNKKSKRFEKVEKTFPVLGKKLVWQETKKGYNLNLQESRGIGIKEDTTIESILKEINEAMDINKVEESDAIRFNEIVQILNQIDTEKDRTNMLEIGFRVPKVQSLFESFYKIKTFGIDINGFNCELFADLGYNVSFFDMNHENCLENVFNEKFDTVCCYHVLEHLKDPHEGVVKIYNSMKNKGVFHVEIPIEREHPQLEYGHLFGFMPGELGNVLKEVGFNVVYSTNKTHTGGSWIERYTAIKGELKND
jgi:hypothetical protein